MFDAMIESANKRRLIIVDGGYLLFNFTRALRLTIYEILVLPDRRGEGIARRMFDEMTSRHPDALEVFAKVPDDYGVNDFYKKMGFARVGTEHSKRGRAMGMWLKTTCR